MTFGSTPAALAQSSAIPLRVTALVVTQLKISPAAASFPTAAAIMVAKSSAWVTEES